MEILRNIVQNILIIILLTVLLEMLLPEGDMRRYVRLVMGLFVIMAVLQPVLSFFHSGLNLETVSFINSNQTDVDLKAAMRRGEKIRAEQQNQAIKGMQQKINSQVLALAKLNKSVTVTGVEVEIVSDPQSASFGQIKKITVTTGSDKKAKEKEQLPAENNQLSRGVTPVEITVPDVSVGQSRGKTVVISGNSSSGQLQGVLADFYGLAREQIKIINQP